MTLQTKHSFFYRNSLTIVFLALFILSLTGQFFTGWHEYNEELLKDHYLALSLAAYVHSGHFISATFENWESEFLQMALFVIFTRWLRQEGSSESKQLDGKEEVDREPDPLRKDAPWAVRKGGFILTLYKHSLTLVLLLLYLFSFAMHTYGSLERHNAEQARLGKQAEALSDYLTSSTLWFESLQNFQSEFLSIVAIIALSIYLRQQGSPQSKPVDAPHKETGE